MTSSWLRGWLIGALALFGAGSCAEDAGPPPETTPAAAPAERARVSFLPSDKGFVTGRGAWRARVGEDGALKLAAADAVLELETLSADRGATSPVPCRGVALDDSGAVVIDRGWLSERVSHEDEGIAQRWLFDGAPAGAGDLEVRVRADGVDALGKDGGALRLTDRRHGAHFVYGAPTWIDADGKRTPLASAFDGNAIVLTVPEALLEGSRYPALLDPTVTVDTDLDPTPLYTSAPEAQWSAQVASDGTDALAIWRDARYGGVELFGTGVSASPLPFQPADVRFLPGLGVFAPRIAYLSSESNGTRHYVAVWTSFFDLQATPVDMAPTGELTVGDSVSLHTPPPGKHDDPIALAAGPGHYFVAYIEAQAGAAELQMVVVDATTHLPTEAAQPLVDLDLPGPGDIAEATFIATRYVLAHRARGSQALQAHVIQPSPLAEVDNFLVTPEVNAPTEPSIASDGQAALVTWMDHRAGEFIWARRMNEAGMIGAEFPLIVAPNLPGPGFVRRSAIQDEYVVTWPDHQVMERELSATVVHPNNTITTVHSGIEVHALESSQLGSSQLIVYDDRLLDPPPATTDAWTITFDGTAFGTPQRLTHEANRQTAVAVDAVAAGDLALAVWSDTRAGALNPDVLGILVDGNGAPSGGLLTVSSFPEDEGDAAVAEGDGEWLVLWRRGVDTPGLATTTAIWAALLDANGAVLDSAQIYNTAVNRLPRVIRDGDVYRATWESGLFNCEALCQFFPASGILAEISTAGGQIAVTDQRTIGESALAPTLAADPAGGALFVWEHAGDIHAARVTGGVPGAVIPISLAGGRQSRPAAAIHDDVALIVWEDDRGGGQQIFGARLLPDDAALAIDNISGSVAAAWPSLVDAKDGYSFLVAFEGAAFAAPEQIWGAWIKTDGTMVDAVPRQLTDNAAGSTRRPDLTTLGGGRMLIGLDGVGIERSERARTVVVDSGATDGSSCDADDDCASRFCADLVCCSTACDGLCERCGTDGACAPVINDADDSCFDRKSCNEAGQCLDTNGETCETPGECASGFCVDGVCCEAACDGECDQCNAPGTVGQCRQQACAPYGCHPDKTCRETCEESRQCVDGFQCVDGQCLSAVPPKAVEVSCGCRVAGARTSSRGTSHGLSFLFGAALWWRTRRRGRRCA